MAAFTTSELRSFIGQNFPQVDPAAAIGIAASIASLDTAPLETCEAFSGFCPSHPRTAVENILKQHLCTPRTVFPHSFDPERDGWICPAEAWQIADALTDLVRDRTIENGGISVGDFLQRLRKNSGLLGLKFSDEEGTILANDLDDADGETDGFISIMPTRLSLEKYAAGIFSESGIGNFLLAANAALDLNSEIVPAEPKPSLPPPEKMEILTAGMSQTELREVAGEVTTALTAIQSSAQTHCRQGQPLQEFVAQITNFQRMLEAFNRRTLGETVGNSRGPLRADEVRIFGQEVTRWRHWIGGQIGKTANEPLKQGTAAALAQIQTLAGRFSTCSLVTITPATGKAIAAAAGNGTISSGTYRAVAPVANATRRVPRAAVRGIATRANAVADPRVRAVLLIAAGALIAASAAGAYFMWWDDDD